MTDLLPILTDKDLMILDEINEDCTIPNRDWDSIIALYNTNNKPFPIPGIICSKIIAEIKDGLLPHSVFKQFGISYTAFKNRYLKTKSVLEECMTATNLTDAHYQIITTCRNDPAFILGQDIERATAFHFNKSTRMLEELSVNAQSYEKYMMLTHPEEFEKSNKENNIELVIKISPGLIDSI